MNNKKRFRYVAILFVIIETFSIIRGYVLIRDWIFMFLMIGVSVMLYPKAFLNKQTFMLFLYLGILYLFVFLGHTHEDMKWPTLEVLGPLSCLSIINVFLYNRDFYGLKMITVIGLLIIVVISLFTIQITINEPNAARVITMLYLRGDIATVQDYQRLGLASYSLVHSFPFLIPLLVYHLKTVKKNLFRFYYLVAIVVPYYMIAQSLFATSLILSTLGILFAIFLSENQKRSLALVIILSFFLLFFTNRDLIISGLYKILPTFEGTSIAIKINDITSSIEYDELTGHVGLRGDLYKRSWNTFFESPLIGSLDKTQAGGHAYFADRLAYCGLVGTMPFIMFFYFTLKEHYFLIEKRKRTYYMLSISFFVCLGFLKNVSGIESFLYLFVFLPGLCLMGESQGNQNILRRFTVNCAA